MALKDPIKIDPDKPYVSIYLTNSSEHDIEKLIVDQPMTGDIQINDLAPNKTMSFKIQKGVRGFRVKYNVRTGDDYEADYYVDGIKKKEIEEAEFINVRIYNSLLGIETLSNPKDIRKVPRQYRMSDREVKKLRY